MNYLFSHIGNQTAFQRLMNGNCCNLEKISIYRLILILKENKILTIFSQLGMNIGFCKLFGNIFYFANNIMAKFCHLTNNEKI